MPPWSVTPRKREARSKHAEVVDDQAGNIELQFVEAGDVDFIEKISRQHLHAHGNVLQVFFDFARSDDDFFQRVTRCS